jgi:hypothetical protein
VPFRRFLQRFTETDEERLAAEVREWSESVPGSVRIANCHMREPVKIAGAVRRITVRTGEGLDSLVALVSDGTGEVKAAWTGRRSIPGLTLGTRIILEGTIGEERGVRKMVNPRYEFAR